MKYALLVTLMFLFAAPVVCQQAVSASPTVIHFVAPPYPREARDRRMMGMTKWKLSVAKDGSVETVTKISGHPVFEKPAMEASRQWRFKPSENEYSLEVTYSFELYEEDCDKPLMPETQVTADLPTLVTIRTGVQCVQVETSSTE